MYLTLVPEIYVLMFIGILAKVQDFDLKVNEFEQSNILQKDTNNLIFPVMG